MEKDITYLHDNDDFEYTANIGEFYDTLTRQEWLDALANLDEYEISVILETYDKKSVDELTDKELRSIEDECDIDFYDFFEESIEEFFYADAMEYYNDCRESAAEDLRDYYKSHRLW